MSKEKNVEREKCRKRKMSNGKNVESIYLEDKSEDEGDGDDEDEGVTFRHFSFRHFSFDQSL